MQKGCQKSHAVTIKLEQLVHIHVVSQKQDEETEMFKLTMHKLRKNFLLLYLDLIDWNNMSKEDQSRSKQIISLWKASLRGV